MYYTSRREGGRADGSPSGQDAGAGEAGTGEWVVIREKRYVSFRIAGRLAPPVDCSLDSPPWNAVEARACDGEGSSMDKRLTDAEVIAELRDGMTIGIGGWGSRRKPMSLVRAILRSSLRRSHHRLLRRARCRPALRDGKGQEGHLRLRLSRLDSPGAALPNRATRGRDRGRRARRGHAPVGALRRSHPASLPAPRAPAWAPT